MTSTEILTARIKHGLALSLLNDLHEWKSGDTRRFDRMVDGRGAGIGSPESWPRNLASICANPVVVETFPNFPAEVADRLDAMGLALPVVTTK